MRILLINDRFTAGGAEQLTQFLRSGLKARGHQVRTLSATRDPAVDYRCWSSDAWYNPLVRLANPSAFLTLRRALAEFQPDVVHVCMFMHQLSPLILALLKGYPTLYYAVLYELDCPKGTRWLPQEQPCHKPAGLACARHCLSPQAWLALMAQRSLVRHWVQSIDQIVSVSHHLSHALKRDGWPLDGVIQPGVPLSDIPRRPHPEPVLACVSRLAPGKGVDTLLRAFVQVLKQLPEARLWIVGDGVERTRLQQLSQQLGLGDQVLWLGSLPRRQVDERLAAAWVQVVPSRWEETFGLVACEAGALSLPVVVSRVGGLPEIVIEGQTGLCVEAGHPQPLTEALLYLLQNPEQARQMGLRARARVAQEFSLERYVDQFEARYQGLARGA